jgi:ribose 5-phosphate isomerase B
MKLAIGSDERTPLTEAVLTWLEEHGHAVERHGPLADEDLSWPLVAQRVAQRLTRGECEGGILFCWTGTGVSMAANKFGGIRAALCDDAETARGARLWNDANVLCLSLRRVSIPVALEILRIWFETDYEPNEEDDACLAALAAIDHANRPREQD